MRLRCEGERASFESFERLGFLCWMDICGQSEKDSPPHFGWGEE